MKRTYRQKKEFNSLLVATLQQLGFDVTDESDEYEYVFAEKEGRRYRFFMASMEMQICDGEFVRWSNSVGNTAKIPHGLINLQAKLQQLKDDSTLYKEKFSNEKQVRQLYHRYCINQRKQQGMIR
jgi:hypothetical protein